MPGLYVGDEPIYGPYVGDTLAWGVYVGDDLVWKRDPVSDVLTGSGSVTLFPYYRFLDLVGIGGGASGQTGNGGNNSTGRGGSPGQWLGVTLERGVDFPESATSLTVTVGGPTGRAPNSDHAAPVNGNATSFSMAGMTTRTAPGGSGVKSVQGTNWQVGAPAGTFVAANGVTYTGGAEASSGHPAGWEPGGGGSGGDGGFFGSRTQGWEGARGQAWVVQRNF